MKTLKLVLLDGKPSRLFKDNLQVVTPGEAGLAIDESAELDNEIEIYLIEDSNQPSIGFIFRAGEFNGCGMGNESLRKWAWTNLANKSASEAAQALAELVK